MNVIGGPAEIAMNGITIPPELLSEVKPQFEEGTRERNSLAGKITSPSGTLETSIIEFTMFLPSIDYLKNIYPQLYTPGEGGEQVTGNLVWKSKRCVEVETGPVNIHFTCEETDDNDVYVGNAVAQLKFNPTYNPDDFVTVDVTLHVHPGDDIDGEVFRLGTGDLSQPSVYVAEAQETVPLES